MTSASTVQVTDEMVERAARAAYENWVDNVRDLEPSWDALPESHRDRLYDCQRAALEAALPGWRAHEATWPIGTPCFIRHDHFFGTVQGYYLTREGKPGVVLQQNGTRVVHVYGTKWLPLPSSNGEDG